MTYEGTDLSPEAIIFDMDGVIADTEKFHAKAKKRVLNDYGLELDIEEIERFKGTPSEEMFKQVFQKHGIDGDAEEAAAHKRDIYHELIGDNVKEIPGASKLVRNLSDRYNLILASSSTPRNIQMILESTGLQNYFKEKISAKEDGIKGKPAPDIYQEAARRLGISPEKCLAIEDSENGAKSAQRAGLKVIGYKQDNKFVDMTVHNFKELKDL